MADQQKSIKEDVKKDGALSEVTLVDKDGNESTTTKIFYEKNKESFDVVGLKPKK